jgi:hypothetical protein
MLDGTSPVWDLAFLNRVNPLFDTPIERREALTVGTSYLFVARKRAP